MELAPMQSPEKEGGNPDGSTLPIPSKSSNNLGTSLDLKVNLQKTEFDRWTAVQQPLGTVCSQIKISKVQPCQQDQRLIPYKAPEEEECLRKTQTQDLSGPFTNDQRTRKHQVSQHIAQNNELMQKHVIFCLAACTHKPIPVNIRTTRLQDQGPFYRMQSCIRRQTRASHRITVETIPYFQDLLYYHWNYTIFRSILQKWKSILHLWKSILH